MKITIQSSIATLVCVLIPAVLPAQYQPQGQYSWDYWYARSGDTCHAYYLQYPVNADQSQRHSRQTVGHAVSKDLSSWIEKPTALMALAGTWNDVGIATGSVVKKDGKWWMIFTGNSTSKGGIGLAYSTDLYTWIKQGNAPVIPGGTTFTTGWKGQTLACKPLADPYIYPEKTGDWYFLVINSQVVDAPVGQRGCALMLKSADLIKWQVHSIISYPGTFERMETTQIWKANGRWYLYFGGVTSSSHKNFVYIANAFDGPYAPQPWSEIFLPEGKRYYIAKVEKGANGHDIYLAGLEYRAVSEPYLVNYDKITGEISLSKLN